MAIVEEAPQAELTQAVLVVGASGGIGRAICAAFAKAHWYVGVHYRRNKAEASLILETILRDGGRGNLYPADIRDRESVRQMIQDFSSRDRAPLTLICSAGLGAQALVLREQADRWADVIATNLTGTFHCFQAVVPHLLARGGGSIIVIGSYAGSHGDIGQAAYAASKAGLLGLVKSAAQEWGPHNIRVNLVLPGWHKTGLSAGVIPETEGWSDHALKRPPALSEVAATIAHLAQLKDVSGQVWNLDSRNY